MQAESTGLEALRVGLWYRLDRACLRQAIARNDYTPRPPERDRAGRARATNRSDPSPARPGAYGGGGLLGWRQPRKLGFPFFKATSAAAFAG